jgi:hypothetical protein
MCCGLATGRIFILFDKQMFPELGHWFGVKDGDPAAKALFDQHYSKHHYKDGRRPKLFVGPGEKMVLMTPGLGRVIRLAQVQVWR